MTPDEMRRAASLLDAFGSLSKIEARAVQCADLARLLREGADAQGWQPIETAPRDGTWMLVYERNRTLTTARWHEGFGGKLVLGGKSWCFADWLMPTHWRPLPPPPQGREG